MGRYRLVIGLGVLALLAAMLPVATSAAGAGPPGTLVVHGVLETSIADDFDRGRAHTATTLLLRDGTRLEVRRTPGLPDSGPVTARVEVAGLGADRLSTDSSRGLTAARTLAEEPLALEDVQASGTLAAAGAPHRVHVAVVRNRGDWGGVSEATLRERVDRVLDGWETEGGDALPSFEVVAWSDFSPASGCGLGSSFWPVVDEARALFPGSDDVFAPDHVVVLVPDECETGGVGKASVGSSLASGGVSVTSLEKTYGESTLAHELGHNFGLDHSGAETCDFSDDCRADEYADLYDVMGRATYGSTPALNSPHRDDLGLLTTDEGSTLELPLDQAEVTRTVTLRPRSDSSGLRTLRVVEPETLDSWYVDYRSGTGRDTTAGYRAYPDYPPGVTVMSAGLRTSYLWGASGHRQPKSWASGTTFVNPAGTIEVRVDAVDPGTSATVTVSLSSDAPPLQVPDTVVVSGQPRVDSYLQLDRSGWPPEADLRFDWLVDGRSHDIFDRIWVSPAMRGSTIRLVVHASLPGHRGVVRQSALLGPVTNPVTGTAQIQAQPLRVGQPVTSSVTTLPVNAARAHQWYADGEPVSGATGTSFTPTAAQVGRTLTLEVTASHPDRDTSVLRSNALGPVPAPLQPGSPAITGTAAVGSRLTTDPGSWPGGTTLSYTWLREDVQVGTQASYTPRAADLGRELAVRVTGTRGGETATATSPAVTVGPGTLVTRVPTVSGRPKVGRRLTAAPGGWTAGTAFAFQWLADGREVRGATGSSLRLSRAHLRRRMSVRVTGSKPGYTSATVTSARTGKVRR